MRAIFTCRVVASLNRPGGNVTGVNFLAAGVGEKALGLASMYPAFDWSFRAPGHHGYQRACDLITGKASWAIWVTSVRMRREDRSSISFLILSQTSAGKMLRRLALNDHAAWVLLASNVRP
jgi:hypothetical protein